MRPIGSRRRRPLVAALAALAVAWAGPGTPDPPGPRASPPIRGAYFYGDMPEAHLDQLAASGFTTGLVKYSSLELTPARLGDIARKRARADSLGLDLYVTLNFHNRRLLAAWSSPVRRFRDRRGAVHPEIPCPADTAYWRGLFTEMVIPVAGATPGPARLALDLELYDVAIHHYPAGPCTCLDCRLEYAGYTGSNRRLAEPWLRELPLRNFTALERAERERLAAFLTVELGRLAVPPDSLVLAVLDLGRPGLPNRALLDALERLALPVTDFTELTYADGASVPAARLSAPYARRAVPVGIAGGLWLKLWRPARLEEEAVRLGRREAGYWIFTSMSLAVPESELRGDYLLDGPQSAYWQALARANRRLASGD